MRRGREADAAGHAPGDDAPAPNAVPLRGSPLNASTIVSPAGMPRLPYTLTEIERCPFLVTWVLTDTPCGCVPGRRAAAAEVPTTLCHERQTRPHRAEASDPQ